MAKKLSWQRNLLNLTIAVLGLTWLAALVFGSGQLLQRYLPDQDSQFTAGLVLGALPFPLLAVAVRKGNKTTAGRAWAWATGNMFVTALSILGSGTKNWVPYLRTGIAATLLPLLGVTIVVGLQARRIRSRRKRVAVQQV